MDISRKKPIPTYRELDRSCSTAYNQALQDFQVTELIATLQALSPPEGKDESELESLAAWLIRQIALQLQPQTIAECLYENGQTIVDLPILEFRFRQSCRTLPKQFPAQTSTPRFQDGETVRWIPLSEACENQTGIVLGHFYSYAPHLRQWAWKYLVWLSHPLGKVVMDTPWEGDLELWRGDADDE